MRVSLNFKVLGTDNLVLVFVAIFTIASKLKKLFANFSTPALLQFAIGLIEYANILGIAKQALEEFKTLSPDKARQVEEKVREQFNIEDAKFEAALEEALGLVVDTYDWIMDGSDIGARYVDYYRTHLSPADDRPGPRQAA